MNRQVRLRLHRTLPVDRVSEHIEHAAERALADGHRNRRTGQVHLQAAPQPVGRTHRDSPHQVVAEQLLHFEHQRAAVVRVDLEGVMNLGHPLGPELNVYDGAHNSDDPSDV
jgi:hypothetical protein